MNKISSVQISYLYPSKWNENILKRNNNLEIVDTKVNRIIIFIIIL